MALFLAVVVWGVLALSVYYVWIGLPTMAPVVSEAAAQIDAQFNLTLLVVAIAFVLSQAALGFFIWKYRDRGQGSAQYLHGNTAVEVGGVILTGITFVGLAIAGQSVWAQVHLTESPQDAVHIEVTGEQFAWNVRYPGPDGKFGDTAPQYYEAVGNTVGILPDDPAGKDDFITLNNIVAPVNRQVEITLRSKDVLHSLFIPNLRIKQDTVPGLRIPLRFNANQTGRYEIACAELCGMNHYRMQGTIEIVEWEEYEALIAAGSYSSWMSSRQGQN